MTRPPLPVARAAWLRLPGRPSGTWAASHDGTADKFQAKLWKKLAAGDRPRPAVLVRTPGADKDIIPDGHHRALAAIAEGEPMVWAYVGRVPSKTGPWDQMHASQKGGNR